FLIPPDREQQVTTRSAGGVEGALARLQASLDRIEHRQGSALNSLEESMELKARHMRGVLADLGVGGGSRGSSKFAVASAGAMGGPFIPVRSASDANSFDRQVNRIKAARADVDRL